MMAELPTYSLDTSAMIDGLERNYRQSSFPGLWERIDELVEAGRFVLSDEVLDECTKKDEATKTWCTARKDKIVVPTDADVVLAVRGVLSSHPLLVKNLKGRDRADPFVIAVAQARKAVVVTGEGSDGSEKRPKIPYVCEQLGIECIRFADLIEREGWKFD